MIGSFNTQSQLNLRVKEFWKH